MTTLYVKRGRRYYPAAEHEEIDSYPKGTHLVICEPGSRLTRFNVEPDRAGLLAAAEPARERIRLAVVEALAMRPKNRPVTSKQRGAWEAFVAVMGNDGYIVEYPSVNEVADRAIEAIFGGSSDRH